MNKLGNLKPERVFYYFEEICAIPRGSGNMKKISDFCVDFAKKNNLEYIREEIGNVIIKKPASVGKESCPVVILQGHLDMVCEKLPECDIDFSKDGIDVYVENGYVKAHGTTLGGDNGIAVAMCMALLEDNSLSHPALEVLFTVDEETGMYGAQALDGSNLEGRMLINVDSEEEGIFTVSCAGGIRAYFDLPYNTQSNTQPCYKITVDGLLGGHSGVDIDKGRLNANMVAVALLNTVPEYNLVSINGGLKDNAIPSFCEAVISTDLSDYSFIDKFLDSFDKECDNELKITCEKVEKCDVCFTDESTKTVIAFLSELPNGIIKWSNDIDDLVETSLNLGVLKTQESTIHASFALRSSVNSEKEELLYKLRAISQRFNSDFNFEGDYPAWEYNKNSILLNKMIEVYKKMYAEEPKVVAIHAGLECGMLSEKLIGLDAVSIGPDMSDIHTPRERLCIASVERVYNYLINLLSEM